MSELNRPAKRPKIDHNTRAPKSEASGITDRSTNPKDKKASKWRGHSKPNININASGLHHDDVGIFVSCDKGQEKRCLQEMDDLLSQYIELSQGPSCEEVVPVSAEERVDNEDIEADIQAELCSMKPSTKGASAITKTANKRTLITLDIPCVVFIRLSKDLDPVKLVHDICSDAANQPDRPRSRYIKRLTPVTLVRKTMNNGIEALAEAVLPAHFAFEKKTAEEDDPVGIKFAIRPTIRNNNQIQRDDLIKTVAEKVTDLGQGLHKVNLTGYEKLILVEVYRNICGMSVVGNAHEVEERFRRFNLSEIYKKGRERHEDS